MDQVETNKKSYEQFNTAYNEDFKWPKKIKKTEKKQSLVQSTICTALNEKQESIASQEYERRINDFKALFDRFPLLQDVLCKIDPDKMHDLIKEKHQTTYDSDYKSHDRDYIISVTKKDNSSDDMFIRDKKIKLKTHTVQTSGAKFTGDEAPEPFIIPISEYRSTIHATGTKIIKDKLLFPKTKKQIKL